MDDVTAGVAVSRRATGGIKGQGNGLRQPLIIETDAKATAECIAEALDEFRTATRMNRDRWAVVVEDEFEVAPLFAALEDCLAAYGIHSVQVTFGKRKYLMVPVP